MSFDTKIETNKPEILPVIGDGKAVEVFAAEEILDNPTPKRRLRLGTVRECRRELAKLYAEAREGKIPLSAATKLTFILNTLANMIRDADLEERIATLEAQITHK